MCMIRMKGGLPPGAAIIPIVEIFLRIFALELHFYCIFIAFLLQFYHVFRIRRTLAKISFIESNCLLSITPTLFHFNFCSFLS